LKVYHGLNHSPTYYDFHTCKNVLVPGNLLIDGSISIDYLEKLKYFIDELIVDSGAAAYYLNSDQGYPEGYLEKYLHFIDDIKPDFGFALDYCFENPDFQNKAKLLENCYKQHETILYARAKKISVPIYPVIQGWDQESYQLCAREISYYMKKYHLQRFGIGSICRALPERVRDVLSWLEQVIDLSLAHAFGQTQRTMPILKEFNICSLDTANAASNAGRLLYVDPNGINYYAQKSNQGSRKHDLEQQQSFASNREKYNYFFKLNKESLESAAQGGTRLNDT